MSVLFKIFIKFLLFLAVGIIVVSPISSLISGKVMTHHHQSVISKTKSAHHQYFECGGHNLSWDFFYKRHLSTPPVHFKLRTVAIIYLLFSLFAISYAFASPKVAKYNFLSGKTQFPVLQKHLVFQTFLI
ncbi:hypothetical protein KXD93_12920 [Mucilaginibacter sp. BJC16-A38]|uniref:hypothetical protein n=1 Tax=Mucilaginibacter phenanthrenivorans TaxID=1234842 RepID=UPI00215878F5|nr:hypothetical protein [Mucilaginibacter phenanthrenivorans]MCR8558551.1 hypothetical protein [Mucilaginibacter phenanthrenivorans]